MDTEYITAREFSELHGKSKIWVLKLAKAGRIGGAYKAGGVWLMPRGAVMPRSLVRGPKAVPDAVAAGLALGNVVVAEQFTAKQQFLLKAIQEGDEFDETGARYNNLFDVVGQVPDWTAKDWAFVQLRQR